MLKFPKVDKCPPLLKSIRTIKKIAAAILATGALVVSSIPATSAELPTTTTTIQDSPIVLSQHSLDSKYIDSYHYSHSSHRSHSSHSSHYSHYSSRF